MTSDPRGKHRRLDDFHPARKDLDRQLRQVVRARDSWAKAKQMAENQRRVFDRAVLDAKRKGATYAEIGRIVGISDEMIRRIVNTERVRPPA